MGLFSRKSKSSQAEAEPLQEPAVSKGAQGVAPDSGIDELAALARAQPAPERTVALYDRVFSLERWHFVGRGQMPDVRPFVGVVEEKPFVMAFTNEDRAHNFAVKNNLKTEGAIPVLSMQMEAAARMILSLANQGVAGVLFNDGPQGFYLTMTGLPQAFAYHTKRPLLSASSPAAAEDPFDAIVTRARQAGTKDAYLGVYLHLFRLPQWHFVAHKSQNADRPALWNFEGELCILAFTSSSQAVRTAQALKLVNEDGSIDLISLDRPAAIQHLSAYPQAGVQRAVFNAHGSPFSLVLEEMSQLQTLAGPPAATA